MLKGNKFSKNLSKSSSSFFPKKDNIGINDIDNSNIENEETRRKSIKGDLKKMVSLKKENNSKAKEILVILLIYSNIKPESKARISIQR